jgi:hypothetical protein
MGPWPILCWTPVPGIRFHVADLPVLRRLGVQEPTGILGNSFLEQFREVEIDFVRREVRAKK